MLWKVISYRQFSYFSGYPSSCVIHGNYRAQGGKSVALLNQKNGVLCCIIYILINALENMHLLRDLEGIRGQVYCHTFKWKSSVICPILSTALSLKLASLWHFISWLFDLSTIWNNDSIACITLTSFVYVQKITVTVHKVFNHVPCFVCVVDILFLILTHTY